MHIILIFKKRLKIIHSRRNIRGAVFEYCPRIRGKGLRCGSRNPFSKCSKCPLAARDSCFRANFAGFLTLFFQIVFSLLSARSNNSMSVGACALVDIGLQKYVNVFSGHSARQHAIKRKFLYSPV